jgi:hypothetical protein
VVAACIEFNDVAASTSLPLLLCGDVEEVVLLCPASAFVRGPLANGASFRFTLATGADIPTNTIWKNVDGTVSVGAISLGRIRTLDTFLLILPREIWAD